MPPLSMMTTDVITEVRCTPGPRHRRRLAHAVANHLAAAENRFLAVDGQVALDANEQLGVGEADSVAGRRPVVIGVRSPVELHVPAS